MCFWLKDVAHLNNSRRVNPEVGKGFSPTSEWPVNSPVPFTVDLAGAFRATIRVAGVKGKRWSAAHVQ